MTESGGTANNASVKQSDGYNGLALINRLGMHNQDATVGQSGENQNATITQTSRANNGSASITQSGNTNHAANCQR